MTYTPILHQYLSLGFKEAIFRRGGFTVGCGDAYRTKLCTSQATPNSNQTLWTTGIIVSKPIHDVILL